MEAAGPKARKSLKQEQLARSEENSTCRHAQLTSVLMRHLHADEEQILTKKRVRTRAFRNRQGW